MKPRDTEKTKNIFIESLKELMGKAAYYRWLAYKFPNTTTQALIDKNAIEFTAILMEEINILITVYQRASLNKQLLQDVFNEIESAKERNYKKELSEIIFLQIEAASKELKIIAERLRGFSEQNITEKAKLLTMIEHSIRDLKLEIKQIKSLINLSTLLIEEANNKINERINMHVQDAISLAAHLPNNYPNSAQDKNKIEKVAEELKSGAISVADFRNQVVSIVTPYFLKDTRLEFRARKIEKDAIKTEEMQVVVAYHEQQREALISLEDAKLSLEEKLEKSYVSIINQSSIDVQPAKENKGLGGTKYIADLLSQERAKENMRPSKLLLTPKDMADEIDKLISKDDNDKNLLESILGELNNFQKNLDNVPVLKSYEESLLDNTISENSASNISEYNFSSSASAPEDEKPHPFKQP